MSIESFTIVSSYYSLVDGDIEFVRKRVEDFQKLRASVSCSLILVDDGSPYDRLEDVLDGLNTEGVSAYRITEDLGFNSHGARNLGVKLSKTNWCLLIDVDVDLNSLNLEKLSLEDDPDRVYEFALNTMMINKKVFDECGGYDEDFVNLHFGDREFISYLMKTYKFEKLNAKLNFMRKGRKVTSCDKIEKTTYVSLDKILQPMKVSKNLHAIISTVRDRYERKDFSSKKTLAFDWVKLSIP